MHKGVTLFCFHLIYSFGARWLSHLLLAEAQASLYSPFLSQLFIRGSIELRSSQMEGPYTQAKGFQLSLPRSYILGIGDQV